MQGKPVLDHRKLQLERKGSMIGCLTHMKNATPYQTRAEEKLSG